MSHAHIAIILLSALATEDVIVACHAAGGDDFMAKPFEIDDLLSRIELAINKSKELKPVKILGYA
jgi:DNA-binding response OmpR family regulator